MVRGNILAALDGVVGTRDSRDRDNQIVKEGEREINERKFARSHYAKDEFN